MRFRIATFNLESLGGKRDHAPLGARIAALRPMLLRLDADLLCLQEIDGWEAPPHRYSLRGLEELLAGTPYGGFHRAVSETAPGHGPGDRHNLALVSHHPLVAARSVRHELVPSLHLSGGREARWDRPILQVEIALPGGKSLHALNLHLRAPVAAAQTGGKSTEGRWRSSAAWAEGYNLAAQKRLGQALEARLLVDAIFDRAPQALVLVAGDLNADLNEMPTRLLLAETEDTGNPLLAPRMLASLERRVPAERRFSVIHGGRKIVLDHLLASPTLAVTCRSVEIFNDSLIDETTARTPPLDSFHAPVLAEFEL